MCSSTSDSTCPSTPPRRSSSRRWTTSSSSRQSMSRTRTAGSTRVVQNNQCLSFWVRSLCREYNGSFCCTRFVCLDQAEVSALQYLCLGKCTESTAGIFCCTKLVFRSVYREYNREFLLYEACVQVSVQRVQPGVSAVQSLCLGQCTESTTESFCCPRARILNSSSPPSPRLFIYRVVEKNWGFFVPNYNPFPTCRIVNHTLNEQQQQPITSQGRCIYSKES